MSTIRSNAVGFALIGIACVAAWGSPSRGQCLLTTLSHQDAASNGSFGQSVAFAGDRLVVGATGVDGGATDSGAAFVFRQEAGAWVFEAKLVAADGGVFDGFGFSAAGRADLLFVGAPQNDCADGTNACGAVYVFQRSGTVWTQVQKLVASDGGGAWFGISLALNGDVLVVGRPSAPSGGAAHVFRFNGTDWVEEQKLSASDAALFDQFGDSVAISADVILVGAPRDDTAAGTDAGSAYVFRRGPGEWTQEQKLTASDAARGDFFGVAVGVDGTELIVGGYQANRSDGWGKAYVFRHDGTVWTEVQRLAPPGARRFGASVALSGTEALVGAVFSGTAHLFLRVGDTWVERVALTSASGDFGNWFGQSVAIGGELAAVGAPFDSFEGIFADPGTATVFRVLGLPDCNGNGVNDACEIDCNGNGIPDDCDIAAGTSLDCSGNGIPDECEPDCNGNTVPDSCDILAGTSPDCTGNGIPDECEPDCNTNSVPDSCDIGAGTSPDCNGNDIPDECDISSLQSEDRNSNGIPDECETACCDPITGACTDGQIGCAAGLDMLGAGTTCSPDCCPQPVFTGADDCAAATVHQITVPPVGAPPVTLTITGDNSTATGPDRCGLSPFTELGDRGWWEAFQIDRCAFVTVDLCCSDPAHSSEHSFITPECPCESVISSRGHGAAIFPPPSVCPTDSNGRSFFAPVAPGVYYYPVDAFDSSPMGTYQMHVTVRACDEFACCFGSTCQMLNELDCAAAGGFFLGQLTDFWTFDGPTCGSAPDGSDNPCASGACCVQPGACTADDGAGGPATQPQCDAVGGTFTGGADCTEVPTLCPACTLQGAGNCQMPTGRVGYMSDLSAMPGGVAAADDFVPSGDTISQVCVWGTYLDASVPDATPSFDCTPTAVDEFRVRVYADGNGLPGVLVGESLVTGDNIIRGPEPGTGFEDWYDIVTQGYTLTLDPPITGLTAGVQYWLEVTDNVAFPKDNTCHWHWMQHFPTGRDGYCASGTDDRPGGGPGSGYIPGSGRPTDLAFCLAGPQGPLDFTAGADQTGACCACPADGGTCSVETMLACEATVEGAWNREDNACVQTCGPPAGDDCLTDAIPISDGLFSFDTSCATRDGPKWVSALIPECCSMGPDVWFEYTATCMGTLHASMCPTQSGVTQHPDVVTGLDGLMTMYHDFDNPTQCPCPGEIPQFEIVGHASDEDCNGIFDAGSGFVEFPVVPGGCWLIRVGGFGTGQGGVFGSPGPGLLDVTCVTDPCRPSPASPAPEMIANAAGGSVVSVKNRYLSFSAGEAGRTLAVQIAFVGLPPPYDVWNGSTMWVGPPTQVSMLPGQGFSDPPGNDPTITVAALQCDPFETDWSQVGMVHVHHEGIVPGGSYRVRTVFLPDGMPPGLLPDTCFSPPLDMTMARWGDVAGAFDQASRLWTAPDGSVDITADVLALLSAFSGRASAPSKPRADLVGRSTGPTASVDGRIDIIELVLTVDAFRGDMFPFAPPPGVGDPCGGS